MAFALVSFGILLLFVACRPADRYRMLADPTMLRSVVLPAALGTGAVFGGLAVVREMRSGTWEGWLLLPRARTSLAATKLGVGVGVATTVVALPVFALWALLGRWGAIGGPLISFADLLFRSVLTQGILVAAIGYVAVASAAQMAGSAHVAAVGPLALALFGTLRLFAGDAGSHEGPFFLEEGALAVAVVLAGASFVLSVSRWGRPLASAELSLRALVATPAAAVVLLFAGMIVGEIADRWRPPVDLPTSARPILGVDADGTIVEDGRRSLRKPANFYTLPSLEDAPRPHSTAARRLWTPAFVGRDFQLFLARDENLFLAYDTKTGAARGPFGRGGLGEPDRRTPFAGRPVVENLGKSALVLTANEVFRLDGGGPIRPLLRGAVHGAVGIVSEDWRHSIAIAIDDGIAFVPELDDGNDSAASIVRLRGVAPPGGTVSRLAVGKSFVAVEIRAATGTELRVFREGILAEARPLEVPPAVEPSAPTLRRRVIALAVGPLFGWALAHTPNAHLERERPPSAVAALVFAGLLTVALAIVARRRATPATQVRRARKQVPWWVFPSVVLGPAYALACALVLWRPRWVRLNG